MRRLDDEHIGGKLLLRLGDTLTTLLLTVGGALAWLSVYYLPSHPQLDLGAVLAFCIVASAAAAVLLTWKHGLWVAVALLAAGGFTCWRMWEEVLEGLAFRGLPPGPWDLIHEYPAVLYLLGAMLALAMALIVVRTRQWYLAAALSIGLVLSPIMGGTLPMWGAMLCSFSAWGAMLLTSLFSRKDPEGLGRAQLLSLAGMWTLILLLVMALPMEGYTRPQWATDARSSLIRGVTARMERFMDTKALETGLFAELGLDLSIPGNGGPTSPAGTDGDAAGPAGTGARRRENLLAAGPRRFTGRRMMRVSSDQHGGQIYLRGGSLGVYTGDAWETLETDTRADPSRYPVRTAAGGGSYTVSIQDSAFQGTYYYPYHLTDGWGTADEAGRLTMPGDEDADFGRVLLTERYTVGYAPGTPEDGFTPLTGPLAEEELRYRQEVVPEYLAVPDSTRNGLDAYLTDELWQVLIDSVEAELETAGEEKREELEENLRQMRQAASASSTLEDFGGMVELTDDMPPLERFQAVMTAASRTAALLDSLAVYDLNTPAMEEGEDFARHFLQEGRGYCVHFATAGALLLRMQGVPARYVSGYTVWLDGQGRGEVMDSDAHAWVEVYVDGCGWYPVEMPPGYSGGAGDVTLSGAPEAPEPEEPGQPDEPEPDQPEEEAPGEPDQPEGLPGEESPDGEEPEGTAFVFPWRALLRIMLILGALCGGYALSFLPRRLERKAPDTNRSAISAYRRYRRTADLGGAEDELLEELGRKAKFSQHTLTEEERETAWARLEAAKEELLARRTGWRKLLLRLMEPLL